MCRADHRSDKHATGRTSKPVDPPHRTARFIHQRSFDKASGGLAGSRPRGSVRDTTGEHRGTKRTKPDDHRLAPDLDPMHTGAVLDHSRLEPARSAQFRALRDLDGLAR